MLINKGKLRMAQRKGYDDTNIIIQELQVSHTIQICPTSTILPHEAPKGGGEFMEKVCTEWFSFQAEALFSCLKAIPQGRRHAQVKWFAFLSKMNKGSEKIARAFTTKAQRKTLKSPSILEAVWESKGNRWGGGWEDKKMGKERQQRSQTSQRKNRPIYISPLDFSTILLETATRERRQIILTRTGFFRSLLTKLL